MNKYWKPALAEVRHYIELLKQQEASQSNTKYKDLIIRLNRLLMMDAPDDLIYRIRKTLEYISTCTIQHEGIKVNGRPHELDSQIRSLKEQGFLPENIYWSFLHAKNLGHYGPHEKGLLLPRQISECILSFTTVLQWYLGHNHLLDIEPNDSDYSYSPSVIRTQHMTSTVLQAQAVIGRENETQKIIQLIKENQAITITGVSGVGKTTIALHVADKFLKMGYSCIFVDLSETHDLSGIFNSLLQALNFYSFDGKLEPEQMILNILEFIDNPTLILLDNFEHLRDFTHETVSKWMKLNLNVKFLITSRFKTGLYNERTIEINPFAVLKRGTGALTEPKENIQFESVQLFLQRALDSNPLFLPDESHMGIIAEICSHLEGIPLAIEMVAAWCKSMSVSEILTCLKTNEHKLFVNLSLGHKKNRQKTMENAVEWSLRLLDDDERLFFYIISIFSGGFSKECLFFVLKNKVSDSDINRLIHQLIEKHLIKMQPQKKESRYFTYNVIKLNAYSYWLKKENEDFYSEICLVLSDYLISFFDANVPHIHTEMAQDSLEKLNNEKENLIFCLDYLCVNKHLDLYSQLTLLASNYFKVKGMYQERQHYLKQAMGMINNLSDELKILVISEYSKVLQDISSWDSAITCLKNAKKFAEKCGYAHLYFKIKLQEATLYRLVGNKALALKALNVVIPESVNDLHLNARFSLEKGLFFALERNYESALSECMAALSYFKKTNDRYQTALALRRIGTVYLQTGVFQSALSYFQKSLEISEMLNDRDAMAWNTYNLGEVYIRIGKIQKSEECYQVAHNIAKMIGSKVIIAKMEYSFGNLYLATGRPELAIQHYSSAESLYHSLDYKQRLLLCFINHGNAYSHLALYKEADHCFDLAEKLLDYCPDSVSKARLLGSRGESLAHRHDFEKAICFFDQAEQIFRETNSVQNLGLLLIHKGDLFVQMKMISDAIIIYEESLQILNKIGDKQRVMIVLKKKIDAASGKSYSNQK